MARRGPDPLTRQLEEVLSSPTKMRVARLMIDLPDKGFTGRELARVIGVSHTSVQEAMKVLIAGGLVFRVTVGRAYLYRTNQESHLFPILRDLFRKERQIRDGLIREIGTAFDRQAISVVLFGSYARGTADAKSDVDVIVVARNRSTSEDRAYTLSSHFLRKYGIWLSAKVLTPAELKRKKNSPYIRAARGEGLTISGRSLDEVIRNTNQVEASRQGAVPELRQKVR